MDTLAAPPEFYAEVIVDSFANLHGGRKRDSSLLYFANLGTQFKTKSAINFKGELWLTDNQSISDFVGDEQGVSNIEASDAGIHIGMLAIGYETQSLSVLFGVYDINYYFDVLESANLFVHSAFGMGSVFGNSGPNGPSTYPQPGLTGMVEYRHNNHSIQFAVADGEPGEPLFAYHTAIEDEKHINVLVVAQYRYENDNSTLLVGGWRYNDDSVTLENAGEAKSKNNGFYVRAEHHLSTLSTAYDISLFGRVGAGASRFNFFDEFYSVGLTVEGAVFGFINETMGLAIAHARTSDVIRPNFGSEETALEISYSATLEHGLAIQPSLQWIGSPGASKDAHDAVLLGVRFRWVYN